MTTIASEEGEDDDEGESRNGQTSVTGDAALRLAEVFGTSPEFWMRLQGDYDIALARERAA